MQPAPVEAQPSASQDAHCDHPPAVTHLLVRLGSAAVADPGVAALLFPLLQHATNLGAYRQGGWQGCLIAAGLLGMPCCHICPECMLPLPPQPVTVRR